MQRFRGGLVFKAHRLCVSLNSRLESNKEEEEVKRMYGELRCSRAELECLGLEGFVERLGALELFSSSSLLLSSLELSDTNVYEPHIRALFGSISFHARLCLDSGVDPFPAFRATLQ